jgi:hypothetical protein
LDRQRVKIANSFEDIQYKMYYKDFKYNISHPLKNTVTTQKIQLFRGEEKPLAGAMQSHQKNDTSPHSWAF